jgi:branched-chain amino acid transport system substrate-binding protein
MKNKKIIITIIICLVLLVAILPLSACGTKAQPGQVLKVGIITPTTGAAAEKGAPMGDANLDAIKYINDELGGVEGYKLEPLWFDSNYDAAKVATIVKNLMDQGALLFNTSSSKEMQAAMEIANRAEFPGLVCFNAPSLHRPPQHIYGQTPDYGDDWTAFTTYYMKNIWKGSGKPKMALLLLNNPTGYGARDAARAAADRLGIDILWDGQVGKAFEHTATTNSETEALTRIKAMNPDVLYISSTPAPTAIIIKNAYELGIYPKITIGCGHASYTKTLIDIIGADITEGVYGVLSSANPGDNVPGMAKLMEYAKREHPKDADKVEYVTAWAQSLVVAEILKNAVKNAGYDVLAKGNVESWRAVETKGIQKLKDYDVGGLQGPVSYDKGDNRLSKSLRIFQIKKGVITPITDWIEAPLVEYEKLDWFGK